jgi:tetratricopeptide (TPR) repeat protein
VSIQDDRTTPDEIAARLIAIADAGERQKFLLQRRDFLNVAVVEALKVCADVDLLRDAGRALHIAEIAAETAALVADPLAEPLALWAQANALLYLGRYRECLDYYERARAVYARHGKELEAARLRVNEIAPLQHLGRYDDALHTADEAWVLLSGFEATRYAATLEMNVGNMHYLLGDYGQALIAYERGRELFATLNDPAQAARMDVNRARALENLDRFAEAEQLLEDAHASLLASAMAQEVARVDLNLGVLLLRQGRYQEALQRLERSHDGFAALGNDVEMTVVDHYRAHVYLALNLLPEALALAQACEREFARRGMKRQMALSEVVQGAAHRGIGNDAAALLLFDRARRIFSRRGAIVEVALVDLERAVLLRLTGAAASARRVARRTEKTFETRGLTVHAAQARIVQSWCALDLERPDEAESLARTALQIADGLELATLAYRVHHVLGRAAEAQGQVEQAHASYLAAVESIERLQSDLWVDEFRAAFLDDKLAVYEDAVRLALSQGWLEDAFELAGRASMQAQAGLTYQELEQAPDEAGQALLDRLRALRCAWHWEHTRLERPGDVESEDDPERSAAVEDVTWNKLRDIEGQLAELTRRWQVRYGRSASSELLGLKPGDYSAAAVQRSLKAGATLVQYSVVQGRVVAFVARCEGIQDAVDLGPAQEIAHLIENWRFGLESLKLYPPDAVTESLCADAQAHLHRFYDLLIAPLSLSPSSRAYRADEPDVLRLYIGLHPALSGVPFAALFDGAHYLVERCHVIHLAGGLVPGDFCPRTAALLAVGYSDGGRLPFAVEEARRVAQVFAARRTVPSPQRLLTEEAAVEAEFSRCSRRVDLIHLATHAAFRADNPFFSWVQLADARLTVADLYRLGLTGRPLVTLSACETGLGGRRGGGLIGFSRALLAAGAGAVVVSLWKVDDASTAALMECFYRQLATGQAAGAALRAAQLEMLAQSRHPLYWAGFVLVERATDLES